MFICLYQKAHQKLRVWDTYYWLKGLRKKIKPGLQKLEFKDTRKDENISIEQKDTINQKKSMAKGTTKGKWRT